jgi:hypothetical protein
MLDPFGVPVKLGSVTANCLLDQDDLTLLHGEAMSFAGKQIRLTARTGAFPGLAAGQPLKVFINEAWVSMQVVSAYQVEDGALTQVTCLPL